MTGASDSIAAPKPLSKRDLAELRARYEAFRQEADPCPDESRCTRHSDAGLGHDVCGCYSDSGPYAVYCERHDPDNILRVIPRLLAEIERLREVASERVEDAAYL